MYLDPIFNGKYPKETNFYVKFFNKKNNIDDDLKIINQKIDFFGLNHYSRTVIANSINPILKIKVISPVGKTWAKELTEMKWEIVPESFYDILKFIWDNYCKKNNTPIYVTENGAASMILLIMVI